MSKRLNLLASAVVAFMAVSLAAAPVAAFAGDAVATCDGKEYSTLQAAIDAASEDPSKASAVELLKDAEENVTITDKVLTLDLGGNTLTCVNESAYDDEALLINGSTKIQVSNGSIVSNDAYDTPIYIEGAATVEVSDVDLTSLNYGFAIQAVGTSTLVLNGGALKANGEACVIAGNKCTTVNGGTFVTSRADTGTGSFDIISSEPCALSINGGDFSCGVTNTAGSSIAISAGTFGRPFNAKYVVSDKALFKHAGGKYEVVDKDEADASSWAYVTNEDNAKVYFESRDEAKAYADESSSKRTVTNIWKVEFSAEGSSFDPVRVVDGSEVGELPEPAAPSADKFFDGWYVGETKVDSTYKPTSDVVLTAKWTGPVAECDGQYFQTLQEAINAASTDAAKPSTVKLLKNTEESVTINGQALTLDLGGNTLSNASRTALAINGSSNVELRNGSIETNSGYSVEVNNSSVVTLSELSIANETGIAFGAGDDAAVTINSGTYSSKNSSAIQAACSGGLVVNGGTFSIMGYRVSSMVYDVLVVKKGCKATINGGDFSCGVGAVMGAEASVRGGTFGATISAMYLDEGTVLYKAAGEKYALKDAESAGSEAWAYLADEFGSTIYYESRAEAKAYADLHSSKRKVTNIWKVTLESLGTTVDTRRVTEGTAVGELPAGEEVAGYTFSGWYDGSTKVDETYEPAGDVTLVAKWTKDVAPDEGGDSDEPTDDPSGDDKGDDDSDKADGGSDKDGKSDGSDKVMPQTGDAASVAALVAASGATLAALGLRRRK